MTSEPTPPPGAIPSPEEQSAAPGLRACLEAILLVADEPVPTVVLAQVLEQPRNEVAAALRDLAGEYTAEGRGFDPASGAIDDARRLAGPRPLRFEVAGSKARRPTKEQLPGSSILCSA